MAVADQQRVRLAYYAGITHVDDQVGRLLDALLSHNAQVIPTPWHVLGRISPIFPPFFPVFCAFSPSRRDASNEPQAGIQGQETAGKSARVFPPSFDTPDA